MKILAQTIKFTETHNKRIPFVGVNVMPLFRIQDGFIDVDADNASLNSHGEILGRTELMKLLDDGFKLYRTLGHARWADNV